MVLASNGVEIAQGAYNCRFAQECNQYNNADTIPVKLTVRGQQVGARFKANICTHGGGIGCDTFKSIANEKIFTQGGIR